MPDVVSDEDLNALAAEFVLGTLDYEERKGAIALLEVDHAFRGIVRIWERRLGELHLMVESVEPDPEIWARIRPKIPGLEQVELAIPSHVAAAPDAVAVASAATPFEAEAASSGDEPPAAPAVQEEPTAAAFESVSVPPTSDDAGLEPPSAEGDALTPGRSRHLDETELRLTELAALLPVTGQEDKAQRLSPDDSNLEPTADSAPAGDDMPELRAAEPAEQGFVPPVPMAARSASLVVAAPAPPAEVMVRKAGRGWVVATCLMGLVAVALAGLISAWRYFPERLPEQLRADSVLNLHSTAPAAGEHLPPPPPPPPPFDE